MPSTLSWLDYSEHDRRQVLDVVDLFREHDTRDELGIGVIRDTFADIFFPGTSTIQTRAKYFLFVPWIYQRLEERRIPASNFELRARQEETRLIRALLQSDDQEGVIGKVALEGIQRLPSVIYWQGLRRWGILLSDASHDYYTRSIELTYHSTSRNEYGDDGSESRESSLRPWHGGLPATPPGFPRDASFKLTRDESEYLRERVVTHVPRTLLAFLLDSCAHFERAQPLWQLELLSGLPPHILEQLRHAEAFSLGMWGAALIYNLMLAERSENDQLTSEYKGRLDDWATQISDRYQFLGSWSRTRFWEIISSTGARIPTLTHLFVDAWLDAAIDNSTSRTSLMTLIDNREIRKLIHDRERSLKRGQARLDNQRALELWNGAAGAARLTYRWPQASRIISDVLDGLGASGDA